MKLVLKSVVVEYDRGLPSARRGLSDVSLAVEVGEAVAVIGPTGSGKTTMLEVMAGLTRATSGSVELVGGGSGATLRSSVGLVYQFPEFQFFEATVYEDVAFGPRKLGLPEEDAALRVEDALRRAGLRPEDFTGRAPLSLSAGEKRRVAIACILVLGRPFLLLDEPTAGLDPDSRLRIGELISSEVRAGRGVIVVSHDLELVDLVAERVVVMCAGSIGADGDAREVFSDPDALEGFGLASPLRFSLVGQVRRRSPGLADELEKLLIDGNARTDPA